MHKGRFSEEQIIPILREQDTGMATAEVCRRHGISSATFYASYAWKSKCGGLEVSDARRLKALEATTASCRSCWPSRSSTTPLSRKC